jgi:hypothetical protein
MECLQFSIVSSVFPCFPALLVEIQLTGDEDPEDLGRKRFRGDPILGGASAVSQWRSEAQKAHATGHRDFKNSIP